jgi:hypothetical protein
MTPILADIGVPMIFPQVILMVFAFVPVVLIESLIIRSRFPLASPRVLKDVGLANLCTTLLRVPLAWGLMFSLELVSPHGGTALGLDSPMKMLAAVTLQAAWLVPYETELSWMIPAAATVLLIPCFLISLFIEWRILFRRWPEQDRSAVFSAVFRANVWSYLFLFIAGSLWTVSNLG